jgi:hypothetical protein
MKQIIKLETCHSLPTVKLYPMTVNLLKGPPPLTHRKESKIASVTSVYFKSGGGISGAMLRKCSPLTQIRRQQEKHGPLLLVYFMLEAQKHADLLVNDAVSGLNFYDDSGRSLLAD